ncbi:GNAT family N-acetyltransferase [Actinacidiphila rubida]|uniref:Predicted acetyltransferase, GNAT family n=1 Tax=Actinacidiphila rubida TaxID=310780 RepID=A0A1H8T1Q5_9ACTN|nr:GNAT family N-acetyltransferase [Actinacidiphila rubida]SEO84920.1 Predicted acetyltransferase, GNAT family [Actinacidiphila rubida]
MGWNLDLDLDGFAAGADTFLRSRAVEHSVQLTILDTLRRRGAGAYGAARPVFGLWRPDAGGEVAAAVLQTPPHPPLITGAPPEAAATLPAAWAAAVASGTVGPPAGVRGEAAAARAFADGWAAGTGQSVVVRRDTRFHRLAALTPREPVPPGNARVADARDRDLVWGWHQQYAVDVGGALPGGEQAVYDAIAHGGRTLWELPDGTPVAMAGSTVPAAGAVRVVAVYTPRALRGRGYAGAVVTAVTRAALDAGAQEVLLVTDLSNPVSNGLYQKLGYVPVRDAVELEFAPGGTAGTGPAAV